MIMLRNDKYYYTTKLKFVVVVREQIEHRKERVHMKVGEYLKEQREQQGLSHAKLAKAAGVSKRSLIYWEQGRDMSVEVADKVLKALGATYKIGA